MLVFINYLSADYGRINSSFDIAVRNRRGNILHHCKSLKQKVFNYLALFQAIRNPKAFVSLSLMTKKSSKSTHLRNWKYSGEQ